MTLLPVKTALERVVSDVSVMSGRALGLAEAGGRVLAEPIVARRQQPSFDASAMDGYAFRSADVASAARLALVGEAAAGNHFPRSLEPGEAVRIFTGAPLPRGADAVLPQEEAAIDGEFLVVSTKVESGQHVRPAGGDFNAGDELLPEGRRMGARELAVAAAGNCDSVIVRRRPRVAILSIGDELVLPGVEPGPDQTIATNAFAIAELARNAGAEVSDLGIVADEVDRVTEVARRASAEADLLVTIGGASVGDHDVTRPGLEAAGMHLDFWRIAMRPGKPLVFGRLGQMAVLGLPGNPVSSFVCGVIFMRPLICAMLGAEPQSSEEPAILGKDLPPNGSRTHYLRATLTRRPDRLPEVTPLPRQDSSLLRVLAQADCLLIHPANADRSAAGSLCSIIRL